MDRRNFIKAMGVAGAAGAAPQFATAQNSEGLGLNPKTKHVILILNGNGSRKKEWYENDNGMSPHIAALAKESFVYTEDDNPTTSNHGTSWTGLLTGNELQSGIPLFPTVPHYVRKHMGDEASKYFYLQGIAYYRVWRYNIKYYTSHPEYDINTRPASLTTGQIFFEKQTKHPREIVAEQFTEDMGLTKGELSRLEQWVGDTLSSGDYLPNFEHKPAPRTPYWEEAQALYMLPNLLQEFKPRMIVYQQVGHDCGHGAGGFLRDETGFFEYANVIRTTDDGMGRLVNFIKNDPYFRENTAIVIRPEFGRDDEMNMYGEIHHSTGYYYCQRSASIWYGPDFKPGVSDQVVDRRDWVPTVAAMFNAPAPYAQGMVRNHPWADHVGHQGTYNNPWA